LKKIIFSHRLPLKEFKKWVNMNLNRYLILFMVITGTVFTNCSTIAPPEPLSPKWFGRMHHLSAAQTKVIPLAANNRRFADPNNHEIISENLKILTTSAKELTEDHSGPVDPIVSHTAISFSRNMDLAQDLFEKGNYPLAQFLIVNSTNYCISCHTRSDHGTKDFPLPWTADLAGLNRLQKTKLLFANRQYSTGLSEAYKMAADRKESEENPIAWMLAMENALAILVRVEGDVDGAARLTRTIIDNRTTPRYVKADAQVWLKDIMAWKTENNRKTSFATSQKKFTAAAKLVNESLSQQSSQSHSALISSLRASALLHELLEEPNYKGYADVLYYSGLASELLGDVFGRSLNESYYESCIERKPHSTIAEKCYIRLEYSIYGTYPDSYNKIELSAEKKSRLEALSALATTKVKTGPHNSHPESMDRGNQ
jgi:hypothetical protein